MKKLNLQIEDSSSKEEALSNVSNSSNKSQVFKKDGFIVEQQGIKNINTAELLTKTIDPKQLEVKYKNFNYLILFLIHYRLKKF